MGIKREWEELGMDQNIQNIVRLTCRSINVEHAQREKYKSNRLYIFMR